MRVHRLTQSQSLPICLEEAWAFLSNSKNLNEVTPPEFRFQTISGGDAPVYPGQIIVHRMRLAPFVWGNWVTEIKHVDPGKSFVDEQRAGPYKFWHHRHVLEEDGDGTVMKDEIHYALPFGPFGEIARLVHVQPLMKRLFDYRRIALEQRYPSNDS